ncbi:MAG: sigma-54-dependent Fis family transcriptional regulator [Polyangiaceae bacterium]|nr:sigma-54-dependent Fis family transcriptional regulator [Polyangiaceae bacterium]
MTTRILIVDDEKLTRQTLELQLTDEGFEVESAENAFVALELLGQKEVDLVLSDLRMPSMDGLEFLRRIREGWPETAVVLMTAYGTVATAVTAMQAGAADYLTKPLHTEELLIRVRRVLERRADVAEIRKLRQDAARQRQFGGLVFRSSAMAAVVDRVLATVDTDASVLIEGETGTGKGVLAKALHDASSRASAPFVIVGCAGLNPNLVESELFGHEAGAFTGAARQRKGRLEAANGGTVLIDDVDDLPLEVQVSLLRFLQDRSFERVGSNTTRRSDVRVVCATKKALPELVRAGRFREDLYYRVNTVVVALPPLRARRGDIAPLAEHFASGFWAARGYSPPPVLLPETLATLLAHDWPGNVRELVHAVEHAVIFARGAPIEPRHLPPTLAPKATAPLVELQLGEAAVSFTEIMTRCEQQLFEWALTRAGGNQVQAAELLCLPRTTFRSRLAALGGRVAGARDDEPPSSKSRG